MNASFLHFSPLLYDQKNAITFAGLEIGYYRDA